MNHRLLPTLACVLALGCGGLSVTHEADPSFRAADVRTYDRNAAMSPAPSDPRVDVSRLDSLVRGHADAGLAARGVRRVTAPDFLLGYAAVLEEGEITYRGMLGSFDIGGEHQSLRYDVGTLILTLHEAGTGREVWRGSATSAVDFDATPEEREALLAEAVEAILDGLR